MCVRVFVCVELEQNAQQQQQQHKEETKKK